MSLTAGTTLGPYTVTAKIGEGGMGEVYQARDTKLDRDVALKVLPEAFTSDPDRLARFEREAKVLASLNHPNIGSIYGLEEAEGVKALVLELVEGPTLADRIKQGPIPIDEALPIAKQIAEALEAAHEQGVIHRDLKPANIKVRNDGTVKVLDFGLAKQVSFADPSDATTATRAGLTRTGAFLGTVSHMAPEQLRAEPADARSDVWAFGVVLYQMLTARLPFAGKSSVDLASAILRDPPETLPHDIPNDIRHVVTRCLSKDPGQRYSQGHEAKTALAAVEARPDVQTAGAEEVAHIPHATDPVAVAGPRRAGPWWSRRAAAAVALAVVVTLAMLGWMASQRTRVPDGQLRVLSAEPPPGTTLEAGDLERGIPVRIVVEHAIPDAPVVSDDVPLATVRLMVLLRRDVGDPNDDGVWQQLDSRPVSWETRQLSLEGSVDEQHVYDGRVTLRAALFFENKPGTWTIGGSASTRLEYPVEPSP